MFAKITEFRAHGGRVQQLRTAAKYDADRRLDCRARGDVYRTRRPILTCRWHVVPATGKLECRWHSIAASAIDEPGQKPAVAPKRRLPRAWSKVRRPAIRAVQPGATKLAPKGRTAGFQR